MASPSEKLQRDLYGPSMFEVTLGAVLSICLGGILAAGYLATQPVETVRVLPRELDPDKTYYVLGSARNSLGKGWLRKKQMLMEPGAATIQLGEDELNTWLVSSKTQADRVHQGGLIEAQTINFRIADDTLQVALPCRVSIAGFNRAVLIQTRGGFVLSGTSFTYLPDEVMVGGLAAHRLPLIGGFVAGRMAAMYDAPEDLLKAWSTLSNVEVVGDQLNLVRN